MPRYTFRNKKTGKIIEEFLEMSEREPYLKKNKNLEQVFERMNYATRIGEPLTKGDAGFRQVLQNIHERNYGSVLNKTASALQNKGEI